MEIVMPSKTSDAPSRNESTEEDSEIRHRDMTISGAKNTYDAKTRTADVMISTGAAVRRRDMWSGEEWDEVLDISPKSVRLARLNAGAPLLDGHNYHDGIDSMLGGVIPGTARIEDGKLLARIQLSRGSAKAVRLAQDLADGIRMNVSAGYRTHREVRNTRSSPETRTAVDWEPLEVSIAPIAAEADAYVRQHESTRASPTASKGNAMPNKSEKTRVRNELTADEIRKRAAAEQSASKKEDDAEDQDDMADDEDEEGEDKQQRSTSLERTRTRSRSADTSGNPVEVERQRVAEIMATGREARMPLDVIERAIKDDVTIDAFRAQVITALARGEAEIKGAAGAGNGGGASFEVIRDETQGRAEAMQEAMLIRVLSSRREPAVRTPEQAEWVKMRGLTDQVSAAWRIYDGHDKPRYDRTRQYLGMGLVEIAAECLNHRGNIRTPAQAYDILQRAFHSTSDFPAIFENTLNKTLLARYQLAMPTYREISVERPFNDFRPHPQVRAGDFPQPQPVTETGELRYGTTLDSKETVSVLPYGVIFSISRHMIVNDEMGAIDQILGSAGDAVLIFENTTFFTMFRANAGAGPVLNQDTRNVYDATNHGNASAAGAGGVPSVASIGTARAAMRAQRSLAGNFLNVPPRIILTGPAQETAADQMVTAISPTLTTSVNPFSGRLRSVSDANITDTSWYLFAEPGALPNFVYGFLGGATGPRIRTEEPFGLQGVRMSLEHDYGCGAIDYRGTYRNAGA
jgi:hypothetical protein